MSIINHFKTMNQNLKNHYDQTIAHLEKELHSLNTGRANSALVENIEITAYGNRTALKTLSHISVPEAKQITIEPYDKNIIKEIERGIVEANLGFNPQNEGNLLRIRIPELTEERRIKLVKVLNEYLENARISLRQARDKAKKEIEEQTRSKKISENEKFRQIEDLDKLTHEFTEKIKTMGEAKEKEIMTV